MISFLISLDYIRENNH